MQETLSLRDAVFVVGSAPAISYLVLETAISSISYSVRPRFEQSCHSLR
jgi:hypothetical protein